MHKLLLACPLLLLIPACEPKSPGDTAQDDDDGTAAGESTDATEPPGNSTSIVDPGDTEGDDETTADPSDGESTSPPPAETTTPPPDDDPDLDDCVPHDPPTPPDDPGEPEPEPDPQPSTTDGDSTGGDTDTGDDTDTGPVECEPLPVETPSQDDYNCSCDVQDEHRACKTADGQDGTRFCDNGSWGECLTEVSCTPGTYTTCFFCDETFGTWVSWCYLIDGVPYSNVEEDCSTPLVLSFDGAPVDYTTAHADFAFSANDSCLARDWPTAATPWLAIDLDRSGSIDGGHELFGSATALASTSSRASNGFLALADLDSDRDGRITGADARWPELLVWTDGDSDRRSTLWELQPLAAHGVVAIDLDYATTPSRCDERGNCEVERARFTFDAPDGRRSSGEVVDVRLGCQ